MSKRIIGIFGCEQTDLCIYLASILENMKKRVLVVDNSFEQKLQLCIPKPEKELNIVTYKNVDYTWQATEAMWRNQEYDFVIIDFGGWPEESELILCHELICVLKCEYYYIMKYREMSTPIEHYFCFQDRFVSKREPFETSSLLHAV